MLSLPPIHDPVRDALDAQVRHFSHLVNLATVIVAIGVALEGIEIIHEGIAWTKRTRQKRRECSNEKELAEIFPVGDVREAPEPQSGEPRWAKRLLRVGLILVVIGVVGEWRYGAKLEDAHNAIHTYDVGKLTEAAQEAGDAKTSALEAAGAATTAGIVAQQAKDAYEKLAQKFAARKISAKKMKDLVKCLGGLNRKKMGLGAQGGPPEIADFALQLDSAFKKAGIVFPGIIFANTPGVIPPGLTLDVGVNRKADATLLTNCLVPATNIAKSDIKRKPAPPDRPDELFLMIGYKPQ